MRARCLVLACAGLVGGCGFHRVLPLGGDDGGAPDLSAPGGDDGGGAGGELGPGGDGLAGSADAGTGPGPLGALPAGFCCQSNGECRERNCMNDGPGPKFCVEDCLTDDDCNPSGNTRFFCDPNLMRCRPKIALYSCDDPSQWVYGTKATGACCDSAAPRLGSDCEGGWCIHSGAAENAYYCTQGCLAEGDCPNGYTCDMTRSRCVHVDTVYLCQ